jgi:hypothetical protein
MNLELRTYAQQFSSELFGQVSEHEKREYGEGHHREGVKLKRFAKKFPEGFLVLVDKDTETVIGTTDFYPLDKKAWEGLADGVIVEEMLPSDAVDPASKYLYIASVIVAQPSRSSFIGTPTMFRMLMGKLWETMGSREGDLHIVGVGSTEKGKILLENWGFKPHEGSDRKKDFRPRFILHDRGGAQSKAVAKHYTFK